MGLFFFFLFLCFGWRMSVYVCADLRQGGREIERERGCFLNRTRALSCWIRDVMLFFYIFY